MCPNETAIKKNISYLMNVYYEWWLYINWRSSRLIWKFLYYGWKHEFIKDGKRIGKKYGIKEKAIEMIKEMLKNDIDVNFISFLNLSKLN